MLAQDRTARLNSQRKAHVLHTVRQALERTDQSVREILSALDIPPASFYRWLQYPAGLRTDSADRVVRPTAPRPTPDEEAAVRQYAQEHPALGYKRFTWQMLDAGVAALRPYQVYQLLDEMDLIARRPKRADTLKRPEPPNRPDEVWHIDLMYVHLCKRWYYLVDIIDGYSRYLVHWTLNTTMLAETVTQTVQEALDQLAPQPTVPPRIIHDHGSQFVSAEWRSLIQATGLAEIKTRVAHPESNGVVERLHRTHREEATLDQDISYHEALNRFASWRRYYNERRPHSGIQYLCPVDFYRGDPVARLAERKRLLNAATARRAQYWRERET